MQISKIHFSVFQKKLKQKKVSQMKKSEKKEEQKALSIRSYFVTDTPDRFLRLGKRFLGDEIEDVRHIDIP